LGFEPGRLHDLEIDQRLKRIAGGTLASSKHNRRTEMPRNAICAAIAALVLVAGGAFAQSQQATETAPEPTTGTAGQTGTMPMMRPGSGRGMMQGWRGMDDGPGRRGMGPHMMLMMMALVDTDASGTLSLEEVQAVHARMFQYADTDDNGELTIEEVRAFMHGGAMPGAQ
jgi:hypothetical protein